MALPRSQTEYTIASAQAAIFKLFCDLTEKEELTIQHIERAKTTRMFDALDVQVLTPAVSLLRNNLDAICPQELSGQNRIDFHHFDANKYGKIKNALTGSFELLLSSKEMLSALLAIPNDHDRERCKRDMGVAICVKIIGAIICPLIEASVKTKESTIDNLHLFMQVLNRINFSMHTEAETIRLDIKDFFDHEIVSKINQTLGLQMNDSQEIMADSINLSIFSQGVLQLSDREEVKKSGAYRYLLFYGVQIWNQFNTMLCSVFADTLLLLYKNNNYSLLKAIYNEMSASPPSVFAEIPKQFALKLQALIKECSGSESTIGQKLKNNVSKLPFTCKFPVGIERARSNSFSLAVPFTTFTNPIYSPEPGRRTSSYVNSPKPTRRSSDSTLQAPSCSPK